MDKLETYEKFASTVRAAGDKLTQILKSLKSDGKSVVGYGAPAKGNTLLTFLNLGLENISYIADKSPLKQEKFTPGTHIPVVDPKKLLDDQPDYVLLLAWNFVEEIMAQQDEYHTRGGKFIIPVPEIRIV